MKNLKYALGIIVMMILFDFGQAMAQNKDVKKEIAPANKQGVIKLIASIVGKWQLDETVDKTKKTQIEKDTSGMDWIEFRPDGKYKSGSGGQTAATQPIDSGSYRLNEQNGILYLQSAISDGETSHVPSEWTIFIKDTVMKLSARGNSHAGRYEYIYNKTKEGLGRTH